MKAIELYENILQGSSKRFPSGFWKESTAKAVAATLTKYLLESKLKWTIEDIKKNVTQSTFQKHKLGGMLNIIFRGSVYELIENAYPDKIQPWELHRGPTSYWENESGKQNGIRAMRWLIEDVLNWDREDIKKKLTTDVLKEHRLYGMLHHVFNGSIYLALNATYPGKFHPWELTNVPISFWKDKDNARKATKWLFEVRLKWTEEEIKEKATKDIFIINGLGGMLKQAYSGSTGAAIQDIYPHIYPWELRSVPNKYWENKDNITHAIRWLVEEKLGVSPPKAFQQIKKKTFIDSGLGGLLVTVFKGNIESALKFVYPDRIFM